MYPIKTVKSVLNTVNNSNSSIDFQWTNFSAAIVYKMLVKNNKQIKTWQPKEESSLKVFFLSCQCVNMNSKLNVDQ